MKRFTVAVVAISGCILGPACQVIVGIGDRIEAAADGDAGGADAGPGPADGGDGGGPCASNPSDCVAPDAEASKDCPAGCLPAAPGGWTGPSATFDGLESGKPTDCPATYTTKELSAHSGNIVAPPATCDCGPVDIANGKCIADVVTWNQGGCPGAGTLQGEVQPAVCFALPDNGLSFMVDVAKYTQGTCKYPGATITTAPEEYDKAHVACGLPQTTACATKAECITTPSPASPFARLCIHKDGDEACPSLDYTKRFVAFKNVDDTRSCTACTATPTGGGCGTTYGTRNNATLCVAAPPTDKTVGTCYAHPGMGKAVDVGAMGPTPPTCANPSGGTPTGTVKFKEPVTFCCNQ